MAGKNGYNAPASCYCTPGFANDTLRWLLTSELPITVFHGRKN